jgi:hypothetical protein
LHCGDKAQALLQSQNDTAATTATAAIATAAATDTATATAAATAIAAAVIVVVAEKSCDVASKELKRVVDELVGAAVREQNGVAERQRQTNMIVVAVVVTATTVVSAAAVALLSEHVHGRVKTPRYCTLELLCQQGSIRLKVRIKNLILVRPQCINIDVVIVVVVVVVIVVVVVVVVNSSCRSRCLFHRR